MRERVDRGGNCLGVAAFIMLFLGTISACVAVFAAASLHFSVQGAARCYSVNPTLCGTASATQSYTQTLYSGPSSPTFSVLTPSCGHQVSGTFNYALASGMANWTIPLSATACFP